MEAKNNQDDIPSAVIDSVKDHCVLVSLRSVVVITKKHWISKKVGEPIFLFFTTSYWIHAIGRTELCRCKWRKLEINSEMNHVAFQHFYHQNDLLKYRYLGLLPSEIVTTFQIDTFVLLKTQPAKMQVQHWILFSNFCDKVYFVGFLACELYIWILQTTLGTHNVTPITHNNPILAVVESTRLKLHLISWSSGKNKLQGFIVQFYLGSKVNTSTGLTFSLWKCRLHKNSAIICTIYLFMLKS